jgi:hypothetical protein
MDFVRHCDFFNSLIESFFSRFMSFFKYIWFAVSGFRTYQNLLNLSLRNTIAYWAVLSALLGIVGMINIVRWSKVSYPIIVKQASEFLPEFSISNGQAFSSLPQPYFSNTNQFPIILDLENQVQTPEKMFPMGIVIKKHELIFLNDGKSTPVSRWDQWPNGKVDAAYLDQVSKKRVELLPFIYPIIWLVLMFFGLLQAFLFTMMAGFLERSIRPSYSFAQLFNIALFCITPGALMIAFFQLIQAKGIRYDLLYFASYCFFFVMASAASRMSLIPESERQREHDSEEN